MAKIKTSFSGHDKFDCKIDWITKGLKAYKANNEIFLSSNTEESIEILGLGVNMIKSLSHWMKVLGLIEKDSLSELGENILKNDLYLENSDTLWILHWNLVKNQTPGTLYNLFFNKMYPNKFSKEDIESYIEHWLNNYSIKLSPVTLSADVDVFLRLYNNKDDGSSMNLFSDLNIITKLSQSNYSLNINSTSKISDKVFLYILSDYIDIQDNKNITSISVDDLQKNILSIQKSLCMSENSFYNKIYNLTEITNGKYHYHEAAGIKQIYIEDTINKLTLLNGIYEE